MEIAAIWPQTFPGSNIVARFDVRVSPAVVIAGMILRRQASGRFRASPPKAGQRPAAFIAPEAADEMAALAAAALERADDRG
jgi:hypothetical protein